MFFPGAGGDCCAHAGRGICRLAGALQANQGTGLAFKILVY